MDSFQLEKMGFIEGELVETILTTTSEAGEPNAAPMGVWIQPGYKLIIRPYEGSQTADNIKHLSDAVINVSLDPRMFLITAFKDELSAGIKLAFEPAAKVKSPRLSGMAGYLEVTLRLNHGRAPSQYTEYSCDLQVIDIVSPLPIVHSRARCAAIECVIHATRIRSLHKIDADTTQSLVYRIDELQKLVERIAPNSPSAMVIRDLVSLLPRWVR